MKLIEELFKILVAGSALPSHLEEFLNLWKIFVHKLGITIKEGLTA